GSVLILLLEKLTTRGRPETGRPRLYNVKQLNGEEHYFFSSSSITSASTISSSSLASVSGCAPSCCEEAYSASPILVWDCCNFSNAAWTSSSLSCFSRAALSASRSA